MSDIVNVTRTEDGKVRATKAFGAGARVTQNVADSLRYVKDIEAFAKGEAVELNEAARADGEMPSWQVVVVSPETFKQRFSDSSSSNAFPAAAYDMASMKETVVIEYSTVKAAPAQSDTIDPKTLEDIRSFKPEDGDKAFVLISYTSGESGVLGHRQRVMRLLRMRYTLTQIRDMVESKNTKVAANLEVKRIVAGIPKKRMELFLSDSVLLGAKTSYSMFLLSLYDSKCEVSDGLLEQVPDYIGRGGKKEATPDEATTLSRRRTFMTSTANYLRPLYTSDAFRAMIDGERQKKSLASGL